MKLTVKSIPQSLDNVSYGEVLNILEKEGVQPSDVLGLYKVSASDPGFSLFLSDEKALQTLMNKKVIGKSKKFSQVNMNEQVVSLRIHWLPLFYDNRHSKAVLCDYGEVLDVKLCKTSHTNVVTLNGTREVLLRVDEVSKQKIPHLVTFSSGQCMLITMQGRPPLCLRCRMVGHVRRDCEHNRTFAKVVRQPDQTEQRVDQSSLVRPAGQAPPEPSVMADPESSDSLDLSLPCTGGPMVPRTPCRRRRIKRARKRVVI